MFTLTQVVEFEEKWEIWSVSGKMRNQSMYSSNQKFTQSNIFALLSLCKFWNGECISILKLEQF